MKRSPAMSYLIRRLLPFVGLLFALTSSSAAADNIALGKRYTFDPPPDYEHCTDPADATQLTDGKSIAGRDRFWTVKSVVGWSGIYAATVTIDLGEVQPIRGVSFNTAAGEAGVEWPAAISILVSDDGQAYHPVGELISLSDRQQGPPAADYHTHRYATDQLRTHGRFVSLVVWLSGPYAFADEIEVHRGEKTWLKEPLVGASVASPKAFLERRPVQQRLMSDVRALRQTAGRVTLTEAVSKSIDEELFAVQSQAAVMPVRYETNFKTVLPLNAEHARVFRAQAKLWRAQGIAPLSTWTTPTWDPLSLIQTPPRETPAKLKVAMMQNESRAAAFNISNASEQDASLRLRLSGLPGGDNPSWVTVHEVAWTDTKVGRPVAAALPEARRDGADYLITVPSGMTRQVWLTLHPTDVKPGSYEGVITLTQDKTRLQVPLSVRVAPLRFPDRPTLHVGGWDYSHRDNYYDIGPGNREAVLRHLREHFVDSPWAADDVFPLNRDKTVFDQWLARWPTARQFCVFAGGGASINGKPIGSPEFAREVGDWIKFWAAHMQKRGLKPEQLILLLVDEPRESLPANDHIVPWANAIHAAKTGVRVFENPLHKEPHQADQQMMDAADILCPNRVYFQALDQKHRDYFAQQRSRGKTLAFYSCSGPARIFDPYSYHRLQAWTCWQFGAESSFFWSFGDAGGGSSWDEYRQPRTASFVPFFLDATTVTPGKHMEAIRESVEDFEYLVMLRDRVASLKQRGVKPAVVARAEKLLTEAAPRVSQPHVYAAFEWQEPKDRTVADQVRVEILDLLLELDQQ
ncbi:MAG: discoidin domain-containing protein [Planctomycetaceae bacterium]